MKKLVLSSWMVCLCSILAVTGCEKRPELITGSVFVVTKGAGSYKMGLVPIYLLPSEKAAEMLDELARRVSSANSELQKKIEGLSADLSKLQEQDGALEKQRVVLSLECDSVDAAYTAVRNAISLGSNGAPPVEVQFIFDAKGVADAERDAISTKLAELRQQTASLESEISSLKQLLDQSQAIAVRTFFSELHACPVLTTTATIG